MGLTSVTETQFAPKYTEFGERTRNNRHYAFWRYSRSLL